MSSSQFNPVFFVMMVLALLGAVAIPPSVTDRAKGKADLLLVPVVKPVRAIAGAIHSKMVGRKPPPGETRFRTDPELAAENGELRQQVAFLTRQLQDLNLVQATRKQLGGLLDYFETVEVIGADASQGRESLSLMPASGVDFSANAPVLYADGVVGKIVGGRVRLVTDKDSTIAADVARFENNQLVPLGTPRVSVRGTGGAMRIENLSLKDAEKIKPGDLVLISDPPPEQHAIVQGRPFGQVESIRPLPTKPLFAEIIVKPRTDLRMLREVLLLRKK